MCETTTDTSLAYNKVLFIKSYLPIISWTMIEIVTVIDKCYLTCIVLVDN